MRERARLKPRILAHRGWWEREAEKNSFDALVRAAENGYGIETDVRDCEGNLVIAHDMPAGGEIVFEDVAQLCAETQVPLAINIKADGLAMTLEVLLKRHPELSAFCFDMSGPELFQYQKHGLPTFTRASEFETAPVLYEHAEGVWLDAFVSEWYSPDRVKGFLSDGKKVAVVSPELHGRDQRDLWRALRSAGFGVLENCMLCTDFPEAATEFFGEGR